MHADTFEQEPGTEHGEPGMFLELGVNRLARDLFLLTAVYALFLVLFVSVAFRVSAERTWSREGRIDDDARGPSGLLLCLHLRKDGRIAVGDRVVSRPEEAAAAARRLLAEAPDPRGARVILNTWRDTPSVRTSDVSAALAAIGLDPRQVTIRFTEE